MRGAQPVWQPHRDVETAVAIDDARNYAPVRQPAELLYDSSRLHTVERGAAVIDADFELGDQNLLFDLKVGKPRNLRQPPSHRFRNGAKRIQIIAEDLQGNLGADSGQQMV